MDWMAPIDIYCERITIAFWAEPINALSNISFLIAAAWGFWTLRKHDTPASPMDRTLISLAGLIGIGSFLFHSFANRGSEWADTVPIWSFVGLFVYASVVRSIEAKREMARAKKIRIGAIITAVVVMILVLSANGENDVENATDFLNGSGQYAPALIALTVFSILSWRRKHPQYQLIVAAAFTFFVSLIFRTMDMHLCTAWPTGTHFMWHCLNGLMVGLLLQSHLRSSPKTENKNQ